VQLNNTMRLMTGTLRPTQLEWLPVLPNIAAANLRRKAAIDVLIEKIELYQDWPVHNDVFAHPPARLRSRKPLWLDLTTAHVIKEVARSLGFGNRGQQGTGIPPYCPETWLRITSPRMVIAEPLPHEHRVGCSQSAEVMPDFFRQVAMW